MMALGGGFRAFAGDGGACLATAAPASANKTHNVLNDLIFVITIPSCVGEREVVKESNQCTHPFIHETGS